MQHKVLSHRANEVYHFPKLLHATRKHPANDNNAPMLDVVLKHMAVMASAFVIVFVVHSFF